MKNCVLWLNYTGLPLRRCLPCTDPHRFVVSLHG